MAISWVNEFITTGPESPNFAIYGTNEPIARSIVNRAIDDWGNLITDFNFDGDNDPLTISTYELTVKATTFTGGLRASTAQPTIVNGLPTAAAISIDDHGGGLGWFFDETPLDDAEFTAIVNPFQASFVDSSTAGQSAVNDFYRTIVHEIGHALGILIINPLALNSGNWLIQNQDTGQFYNLPTDTTDDLLGSLTYVGIDEITPVRTELLIDPNTGQVAPFTVVNEVWEYQLPGADLVTLTEDGGGHFYEGHPNDPVGLTPLPNDLMNPGRTVPPPLGDPIPTTRQFISDLNVQLLADAYDYSVTLPSELESPAGWNHTSSMHTTFDSLTGTLLVQGLPDATNETFTIAPDGDEMVVTVSYSSGGSSFDFVSRFLTSRVDQIIVAGNGGTDTMMIDDWFAPLVKEVDYVVSSNEDAGDPGTLGNGIVDLDSAVPGNQVTLRGAIQDANALGSRGAIYLPPGTYALTRNGYDTSALNGDLDIVSDVAVVGNNTSIPGSSRR